MFEQQSRFGIGPTSTPETLTQTRRVRYRLAVSTALTRSDG
jgi:hypothetical protein